MRKIKLWILITLPTSCNLRLECAWKMKLPIKFHKRKLQIQWSKSKCFSPIFSSVFIWGNFPVNSQDNILLMPITGAYLFTTMQEIVETHVQRWKSPPTVSILLSKLLALLTSFYATALSSALSPVGSICKHFKFNGSVTTSKQLIYLCNRVVLCA